MTDFQKTAKASSFQWVSLENVMDSWFPYGLFGTTRRLRAGIAEQDRDSQRYIEINRNGLIRLSNPLPTHQGKIFLNRAVRETIALAVYAARLYQQLDFFGNIYISAKIIGVQNMVAVGFENQNPMFATAITERVLSAEDTVFSVALGTNPIKATKKLIEELLYPTHLSIEHVYSEVERRLAIKNIYQDGTWLPAWVSKSTIS